MSKSIGTRPAQARIKTSLHIQLNERERLAAFATSQYPREACGCLIGERDGTSVRIRYLLVAKNLAEPHTHEHFELDPVDLKRAEEEARELHMQVVGIWHSHPDKPATPSESDRAAAWEGWSYLIASVNAQGLTELRSWRLVAERFEEETLAD